MNKILFLISAIVLAACSQGSIINNSDTDKKVGEEDLKVGECMHFSGGFFGFGGDAPITVTQADGSDVPNGKDLDVGHYEIKGNVGPGNSEETVSKVDEACEKTEATDDTSARDGETDSSTTPETPSKPADKEDVTNKEPVPAPSKDDSPKQPSS